VTDGYACTASDSCADSRANGCAFTLVALAAYQIAYDGTYGCTAATADKAAFGLVVHTLATAENE
jgi:hypothetical protein